MRLVMANQRKLAPPVSVSLPPKNAGLVTTNKPTKDRMEIDWLIGLVADVDSIIGPGSTPGTGINTLLGYWN